MQMETKGYEDFAICAFEEKQSQVQLGVKNYVWRARRVSQKAMRMSSQHTSIKNVGKILSKYMPPPIT